jgi:hypothetical protein
MARYSGIRRVLAVLASVGLFGTGAVAVAGTAHADVTLVECVQEATYFYDPGLTLSPQDVDSEVDIVNAPCVVPNTSITAGLSSFGGPLEDVSCLNLADDVVADITTYWNDGTNSTAHMNISVTTAAGQIVVSGTGTVIDGRFEGASVLVATAAPAPNLLECLGNGVDSYTAVGDLLFYEV